MSSQEPVSPTSPASPHFVTAPRHSSATPPPAPVAPRAPCDEPRRTAPPAALLPSQPSHAPPTLPPLPPPLTPSRRGGLRIPSVSVSADRSDLFCFDQFALQANILVPEGDADKTALSEVEYDEYAVYKVPLQDGDGVPGDGDLGERFVPVKVNQAEIPGVEMLDRAMRQDYGVDVSGAFAQLDDPVAGLEGRVRRVVCLRRKVTEDRSKDGLSMTRTDLDALELHPATLQYTQRTTTESRFWSRDGNRLSILLSFSSIPRTPYDFVSLSYSIKDRTTNVLIRQSWNPRRKHLENLDEYDDRLEACRTHWAHPVTTPVVLLQVQLSRTEEAVAENHMHVALLEADVSNTAGFETSEYEREKRQKLHSARRMTAAASALERDIWGEPLDMNSWSSLMKTAHEVLKHSIKLLDTIRWMERAARLLILAGDELSQRMGGAPAERAFRMHHTGNGGDASRERRGSSDSASTVSFAFVPTHPSNLNDPLDSHWHELRQYLDGLIRLCISLETDRRMADARVRAQIDIIYSKIASEDNALNARMAVSSSRDSSSMKALAVITAIFLPAEFLGTLFGMSMFDFLAPEEASREAAQDQLEQSSSAPVVAVPAPVLSRQFWVYWVAAVPLTLFTLLMWRAWWVTQDRYFRRHLSKELSEERYWTADGEPRTLDSSYLRDFFTLSARRDEKRTPRPQRPELSLPPMTRGDTNDFKTTAAAAVARSGKSPMVSLERPSRQGWFSGRGALRHRNTTMSV